MKVLKQYQLEMEVNQGFSKVIDSDIPSENARWKICLETRNLIVTNFANISGRK